MRKESLDNFRVSIFSSFKDLFFIAPYMFTRALSMLINLWILAYLINNYQYSTLAIARFIIYGFIVEFLRNIYLINFSAIPKKLRDVKHIFNSNNTLIVIFCAGFCSYFSYKDTNSLILSLFIFAITFLLSYDVDVIRANNNKQPINQYLFLIGLSLSFVLSISFTNKDDLINPFIVLALPLFITALYNLIFLIINFNSFKKSGFLALQSANIYSFDYRLIILGFFPGFILNIPLTFISRDNSLLLDLSLIGRTFNLFVSILPIINNLALKGFFNRNKKFLFNNQRYLLLIFQIGIGSIVAFLGLIFLNLFLDKNISVNLYFYALSLFISFSIFHSGILLPIKYNNFISNKIKNLYFLFVCILFYLIGRNIILISFNPLFVLVLFQSFILILSYKFISKK